MLIKVEVQFVVDVTVELQRLNLNSVKIVVQADLFSVKIEAAMSCERKEQDGRRNDVAGSTMQRGGASARKADYHHGDLKRALLKAAGELLEEVGYEGFTLRKCATRAGVSPSAPAHHFRDAAGLLSSLAVEGFGALSPILRVAFEGSQHSGQSSCRAVAMAYLRFAHANPALYKVMFASKLDADYPDLKAASEMCFADLEASVTKLFPQRSQSEVRAVSLRMWASVHGLSMLLIENRMNFLLGKGGYENVAALEAEWLAAQAVSIP